MGITPSTVESFPVNPINFDQLKTNDEIKSLLYDQILSHGWAILEISEDYQQKILKFYNTSREFYQLPNIEKDLYNQHLSARANHKAGYIKVSSVRETLKVSTISPLR